MTLRAPTIPGSGTTDLAKARPSTPSPAKAQEAAQAFEAIFLRKMLESLQKTSNVSGKSSGQSLYKSMMVDAMADAMAAGGGLGLADALSRSFISRTHSEPESGAAASSEAEKLPAKTENSHET